LRFLAGVSSDSSRGGLRFGAVKEGSEEFFAAFFLQVPLG
jgi:hypothetical protein